MKKILQMIMSLMIGYSLLVIPSAKAADPSNNLSVRLESPTSPTRDNNFLLSFSVLDRASRTPVVSCYIKKPGSGSFSQFDSNKVSVKPIGDNNTCSVDGSLMNEQGSYEFYVLATAEGDSEESNHVTVNYDITGPSRPTSYSKEHVSACRWIIKFHTADDGLTQKVEVYSSDQTNFDTHAGTRVGTVTIGPNQDGEFVHDRGGDCDKPWYYVIRAFDSVGNQSPHIGDSVTVTTTTPASSTSPALVVAKNTGNVLGQTNPEENSEATGEVMGEQTTLQSESPSPAPSPSALKSVKTWTYLALILAVLGVAYVYLKSFRHSR